jgi:hypothetical protein
VCVQQFSVQCKGYNLIGVTTVEASETRGTTALVYCLIGSSLYTGTVQGWWSTPPTGLTVGRGEVHPNWSDGQQGRSQLSTSLPNIRTVHLIIRNGLAKKFPLNILYSVHTADYLHCFWPLKRFTKHTYNW